MFKDEIDKLIALPEKTRDVIAGFTDKLENSCGENLVSVILFGSAAGGDYVEGKSDINVLIILESVKTVDLNIVMESGKSYAKKGLAIPLIFEKDHIATSLDTFPIEFSDMQEHHVLLYGTDPFEKAEIEGKNLRYQCEREFKSILVNLRRGFLQASGKQENIEALLAGSLSSVLAACRGLIWLSGKTPAHKAEQQLEEVAAAYKIDVSAIKRVWQLKHGHSGATATLELLLDDYIRTIANLATMVDKM